MAVPLGQRGPWEHAAYGGGPGILLPWLLIQASRELFQLSRSHAAHGASLNVIFLVPSSEISLPADIPKPFGKFYFSSQ